MFRRCIAVIVLVAPHAATSGDKILDIRIAERQIVGDAITRQVNEGDDVELRWYADEDVELHLHGYEIAIQVPAGGSANMTFTAKVSGRFPISHHGFGEKVGREHGEKPILYLEVYPE
ncbi:MAG: hypothetical protein ACR2PS_13525 [Pseudomonadales bacterium]